MKFVDEIEIRIRSGKGGRGMVSFKADHGRPKLGADGGDGGFGGSVYLQGRNQLSTLSALNYKRWYCAEHGVSGGSNNKTGRNGKDLVIPVPLGTIASNLDTHEVIAEVLEQGQKIMIAEGGKRGLGNARFLSSRHQAPEEFTPGGPSVEFRLGLELKLVADVGFAGLPNAGKSTLLSAISAARPKVADYPFTTLIPYLGVVKVDAKLTSTDEFGASFVAADIPGLIAGASLGKGLGHDFLRHIERTRVITYVVDVSEFAEVDALEAYKTLRHELESFDPKLVQKPSCIVLSKCDALGESQSIEDLLADFAEYGDHVLAISSVQMTGIEALKAKLFNLIQELNEQQLQDIPTSVTPTAPQKTELFTSARPLPL